MKPTRAHLLTDDLKFTLLVLVAVALMAGFLALLHR